MVSRLVVVPSDGLSSLSAKRCKGGKRTIMVKNNECKVTVDGAARYDFPYFVPIEDGDEITVKHYKEHDVPVANIALPGRKNAIMRFWVQPQKKKQIS